MSELHDILDKIKRMFKEWWYRSLAVTVAAVIGFASGSALEEKLIVDDCKFMGSFRDGTQVFSCQPRVR